VGQHKETGAESNIFLQTKWLEQDGSNPTSLVHRIEMANRTAKLDAKRNKNVAGNLEFLH
jgi:hypothetical protein